MKKNLPWPLLGVTGEKKNTHLIGHHVIIQAADPSRGDSATGQVNLFLDFLPRLSVNVIYRLPSISCNQFEDSSIFDRIADRFQAAGYRIFQISFTILHNVAAPIAILRANKP